MAAASNQSTIEAIVQLAEEIARLSPECASRASQIVDLARAMESEPDEETVQDALEAETGESDLSGVSTRKAAAAVVKALK
jgi:hypothetical protein